MVNASAQNMRTVSDLDLIQRTEMASGYYAGVRAALTDQSLMELAGSSFATIIHNKEHCISLHSHLVFQL
jgi:hypothetical protein